MFRFVPKCANRNLEFNQLTSIDEIAFNGSEIGVL